MKLDDIEFQDAVFSIPKNAVKLVWVIETYEEDGIEKVEAAFGPVDIREAFKTFEDTIAGEYPVFTLTEEGKKYVEHFTAYFVNRKIYEILDKYEIYRKKNFDKIIQKLNTNGIYITSGQVYRCVKKESLGRYDIAYTLYKKGYAVSPANAYAKYLDKGMMAYVERKKMDPVELIETIRKCGGVPVLAHPNSLKFNISDTEDFVKMLLAKGLCGIEVYNPRNTDQKQE